MKKKMFPSNILTSLTIILLIVVYSGGTLFILEEFIDDLGIKITLNFLISITLTLATLVVINIFLGNRINFNLKIRNYWLLVVSCILVLTFVIFFNTPLNRLINSAIEGKNYKIYNPFDSSLLIFSTCILSPILEELIFRGVILKGLLTRYSEKLAIFISAIIFSIVHFSPSQIFGAFIYGLFFGLIYSRTRSIGYTIILHFIANMVGLFSVYLNYIHIEKNNLFNISSIYGPHTLIIILISLIIFIYSFFLLKKKLSLF